MLRYFNDAEEVLNGPSGIRGDGDATPGMAPVWNRSYRELDRCLRKMRDEAPWLWWDVRERFLGCDYRVVECPLKRTQKGPVPRLPANCEEVAIVEYLARTAVVRVRRWSELVRPERVAAGVRWVSDEFRGEPFLPEEMREAA